MSKNFVYDTVLNNMMDRPSGSDITALGSMRKAAKALVYDAPKFVLYDAAWSGFAEGLGIKESRELRMPWEDLEKPDEPAQAPDKEENTEQSSPYRYNAFGSSRQIRIIELLPGTRQDDIKCQLIHYDLQKVPRYEALSYCWGDQMDLTPIQINDLTFRITRNLRSALLHLRNISTSRLLWVDAICINQQNLTERADQVSIMADIYKGALQTVIWLGPGDERTPRAFSQLNTILAQAEAKLGTNGKIETTKKIGDGIDRNDTATEAMLALDWWTRVWVVQEVVLSQEAVIVCGTNTMRWDSFARAIETGLANGIWEEIVLGFVRDSTFDHFRSLMSIGRSIARESIADQLLDLLVGLRNRNSSDPRDKIFAALGMINGHGNEIGILPDYQSPVEDIYTRTAASILIAAENLDILGVCSTNQHGNSTLGLSSWVPDWSVTHFIPAPLKTAVISSYKATGESKTSPKFLNGKILVVSGHIFDTISSLGDTMPDINDEPWGAIEDAPDDAGILESLRDISHDFTIMYNNLVSLVPHLAIFISWEKFAAVNEQSMSTTGESHMEVYWRTLCADQMPDGYDTAKSQFRVWYDSLSPIRSFMNWKMDYFSSLFKPIGFLAYIRSTWKEYPAFSALMGHVTLRRIARTKKGHLCLVPGSTQPGDEVWLFRGSKVPLVVRPDEGEHWKLVGEAFIHGIMNGEGYDDAACRDLHLK